MSNLEKRIDNLEKQAGGKGVVILKMVYEGQEAPRSPTQSETEEALAKGYESDGLLVWDSKEEKFFPRGGAK